MADHNRLVPRQDAGADRIDVLAAAIASATRARRTPPERNAPATDIVCDQRRRHRGQRCSGVAIADRAGAIEQRRAGQQQARREVEPRIDGAAGPPLRGAQQPVVLHQRVVEAQEVLRGEQQRSAADGFVASARRPPAQSGTARRSTGCRSPAGTNVDARPGRAHVHEVEADEAEGEEGQRDSLRDQARVAAVARAGPARCSRRTRPTPSTMGRAPALVPLRSARDARRSQLRCQLWTRTRGGDATTAFEQLSTAHRRWDGQGSEPSTSRIGSAVWIPVCGRQARLEFVDHRMEPVVAVVRYGFSSAREPLRALAPRRDERATLTMRSRAGAPPFGQVWRVWAAPIAVVVTITAVPPVPWLLAGSTFGITDPGELYHLRQVLQRECARLSLWVACAACAPP